MSGDYLVLIGDAGGGGSPSDGLAARGWSLLFERPGLQVHGLGPRLPVQAIGARGALIGVVRPRPDAEAAEFQDGAVPATCNRLLKRVWGSYVAVFAEREPGDVSVFRDPSGSLESVVWRAQGRTIVTSARYDHVPTQLQPVVQLDWNAVRDLLIDRSRAGGQLALRGVETVGPGNLASVSRGGVKQTLLWRPSNFAQAPPISGDVARRRLRTLTDGCVAQLVGDQAPALVEVSGGLDSAIVATTICALGGERVKLWLNNRSDHPRGDERRYARDVAERGGFVLTEHLKSITPLDATAWSSLCGGWRPPFSGLDVGRDRAITELCEAHAIERIYTGQGGDMVFFQEPMPAILSDHLRLGGAWREVPKLADGLAAWGRRSGWRVLGPGLRGALGAKSLSIAPSSLMATAASVTAGGDHAWRLDAVKLPPAKRFQVFSLVACQAFNTGSLRQAAVDVVHPLLAQPIVEFCLRLSTPQLTQGKGDRVLARQAFAERLPPSIVARRAKGELSCYYGQLVAASLPYLRPLLLDGVLVQEGVLDRRALEDVLTPEHLIVHAPYTEVLEAALVETWAADWRQRLSGPVV